MSSAVLPTVCDCMKARLDSLGPAWQFSLLGSKNIAHTIYRPCVCIVCAFKAFDFVL